MDNIDIFLAYCTKKTKIISKNGAKLPIRDLKTVTEWWLECLKENARLERRIKKLEGNIKQIEPSTGKVINPPPELAKSENMGNIWSRIRIN